VPAKPTTEKKEKSMATLFILLFVFLVLWRRPLIKQGASLDVIRRLILILGLLIVLDTLLGI
jgi:hypothetical protein